MDVMKEDMQKVDVTEENAGDRMRWRQMIFCGLPKETSKKKRSQDDITNEPGAHSDYIH